METAEMVNGSEITKQFEAIEKERFELKSERSEIDKELLDIKEMFLGGKRVPNYEEVCRRQKNLKVRKLSIEARLAEIKIWWSRNNYWSPAEVEDRKKKRKQNKTLDDIDLKNCLSEPQSLLHKAYVRLERMWRNHGITNEDRGLKDTIEDYLKRHGIMLS